MTSPSINNPRSLILISFAIIMMAGCSNTETQGSKSTPSSGSSYLLTGVNTISPEWNCRSNYVKKGNPTSSEHLSSIGSIVGLSSRGSYVVTHDTRSDKPSKSTLMYGDGGFEQIRFYPESIMNVAGLIEREFGKPLSIIRSDGRGCMMGEVTLIYSSDRSDADGSKPNTTTMCRSKSSCRFERDDPCTDSSRLTSTKILVVSLDSKVASMPALEGLDGSPKTRAVIKLTNGVKPNDRLSDNAPICEPDNNPFIN